MTVPKRCTKRRPTAAVVVVVVVVVVVEKTFSDIGQMRKDAAKHRLLSYGVYTTNVCVCLVRTIRTLIVFLFLFFFLHDFVFVVGLGVGVK